MRAIILKSQKDIEKMREAGKIIVSLFDEVQKIIAPGVSTQALDDLAQNLIKSKGGSCSCLGYGDPPFPAAICTSINEEIVHGIPSPKRILKEGDIVTVDVVVTYQGYMADAARTFPVGKISKEKQKLIEATERSFWMGAAQALIGKRIGDISSAVQVSAETDQCSVIRDFQGHGIGKDMHEDPPVPNYGKAGRGPRLAKGMAICIEPMIALGHYSVALADDDWTAIMRDGSDSAHYENTVIITDGDPLFLTLPENFEYPDYYLEALARSKKEVGLL